VIEVRLDQVNPHMLTQENEPHNHVQHYPVYHQAETEAKTLETIGFSTSESNRTATELSTVFGDEEEFRPEKIEITYGENLYNGSLDKDHAKETSNQTFLSLSRDLKESEVFSLNVDGQSDKQDAVTKALRDNVPEIEEHAEFYFETEFTDSGLSLDDDLMVLEQAPVISPTYFHFIDTNMDGLTDHIHSSAKAMEIPESQMTEQDNDGINMLGFKMEGVNVTLVDIEKFGETEGVNLTLADFEKFGETEIISGLKGSNFVHSLNETFVVYDKAYLFDVEGRNHLLHIMQDESSSFLTCCTCVGILIFLWFLNSQKKYKSGAELKQTSCSLISWSLFRFKFEVKRQQSDLQKMEEIVKTVYPSAIENRTLVERVNSILLSCGYKETTTIVATSLCCDEVNRDLEKEFRKIYGDNFSMGGLAGFPFCGKTSFGAMANHIPDDGSCLIVYGPHVGIDNGGNVGKVNRRGRNISGVCCGSATAALSYVKSVSSGVVHRIETSKNVEDAQQEWVSKLLLPYAKRLNAAKNEASELPLCLYHSQDKMMNKIVTSMSSEVPGEGKIALLGGIQINTPHGIPDYFLPMKFELKDKEGNTIQNLITEI